MILKQPEWEKRLQAASHRQWLACGMNLNFGDHPAALWCNAIRFWHADGDKSHLIALVEKCVQPPPELLPVACEAVADALRGDRTRARNSPSSDLRLTLIWRMHLSLLLRHDMKRTWKTTLRGETLNQAVADRVNADWRAGGSQWYAPLQ
ncbi:MAG: hypothetical protein ACSLE5_15370 [Porticoccaceae bacterium]